MKKLLIIVPSIGIGGQEKIALNTAHVLSDCFDVTVIVFQRKNNEYKLDGCNLINISIPSKEGVLNKVSQQIKRIISVNRIKRKNKIYVSISIGHTANITNAFSNLLTHCKTVGSIHGFGEVKKSCFSKWVWESLDRVICISKEMQYQVKKIYPNLSNMVVIQNGYDIDPDSKLPSKKGNNLKLVAMGRLEEVKGYRRLIKSFSIINATLPNATLTFIGDGSQKEELINLVGNLGLEKNVTFMGYMENPVEVLSDYDVFLMSSYSEGFPNSLIEAMSCGLAVVSVDCLTGPREILAESYDMIPVSGIKKEKFGILVENLTNENDFCTLFSNAVLDLLTNGDLLEIYKNMATNRSKDFSLNNYRYRILELLDNL